LKNDDFFSTKALGRDERAESSSREWPLWQPTKIIQNRAVSSAKRHCVNSKLIREHLPIFSSKKTILNLFISKEKKFLISRYGMTSLSVHYQRTPISLNTVELLKIPHIV
jgi:hypothetical protein